MTKISQLLRTQQKIFNLDDLAIIWQQEDRKKVQESARSYARQQQLFRLTNGIYSLQSTYDPWELAAKLNPPAYITGNSVLAQAGIIFQYSQDDIHLFALRNRRYFIDGRHYIFHQLSEKIFWQEIGLEKKNFYWQATPERAVIDALYLNKQTTFDNLQGLDFEKMRQIAEKYEQKTLIEKVLELEKIAQDEK